MFHNIGRIYMGDLRKVAKNWVAIVIIAGLAILPSLYAWINIYASWDPYGNTGGVKVAVVNLDEGSSIAGNEMNIGVEVSDSLRENDKLGWTFYDTIEEGIQVVDSGKVYAAIIIPKDFSQKMGTVLDETPQKPTLEYYVNEKINAIAPKMTDSGASTIQKQITGSFVSTVTEKIFDVLNQLGITLDDEYPKIEKYKNMIYILNDAVPNIDGKLDDMLATAKDGLVRMDKGDESAVYVRDTLTDLIDFTDHFSKDLHLFHDKVEEVSPEVKEDLRMMQSLSKDMANLLDEIQRDIAENKPGNLESLQNAVDDMDQLEKDLLNAADKVGEISRDGKEKLLNINVRLKEIIADTKSSLHGIQGDLLDTRVLASALHQIADLNKQLANLIKQVSGIVNESFDSMENKIKILENTIEKIEEFLESGSQEKRTAAIEAVSGTRKVLAGDAHFSLANSILKETEQQLKNNAPGEAFRNSLIALKTQLELLRNKISALHSDVDNRLYDMQVLAERLSRVCDNMGSSLTRIRRSLSTKIDKALTDLEQMNKDLNKVRNKLEESDPAKLSNKLADMAPRAADLKQKLEQLKNVVEDDAQFNRTLEDAQRVFIQLDNALGRVLVNIDETLIPKLLNYVRSTSLFVSDVNGLLSQAEADLDVARDVLNRLNGKGQLTVDEIQRLKNSLPNLSNLLNQVTGKIREIDANLDLKSLINLMSKDGSEEGDFISAPVLLNTHKLYPMENYGAGLTPFYTTLCLWVGALLLSALLTTKAKNIDFIPTAVEEFIGKYLIYGSIAVLQGTIAALGDIFVLGVKPVHPILLVVLAIYYSVIFSMIVYTLASLFGNVGKAIAVVFLVLQLAGAGGTFPIQVTPAFFQTIHKFLPFTYAIGGMREAIAGIYYPALLKDIFLLMWYFVFFLALGLCLKKWVSPSLARFAKKLGQSGVIEH